MHPNSCLHDTLTQAECVGVCLSGGGGRAEEEADDYRLPAEEVRAEQETSGDLQQETARLCSGTALTGVPLDAHRTVNRQRPGTCSHRVHSVYQSIVSVSQLNLGPNWDRTVIRSC